MGLKSIQDIIKTVEMPSRYIGNEINAVYKDHNKTALCIALAFPDLYEIGTSHFGVQILYHILNKRDDIACERVFAPAPDMESVMRENGISMFSRETQTPLNQFHIIGFSLLYELNYSNVLTILDLARIPFLSKERKEDDPLIIAGGPCTFNPEPVADIFDAMIIGDGEDIILQLSEVYLSWKKKGQSKKDLLREWSKLSGIYIPSFFTPHYVEQNGGQIQRLNPVYDDYTSIKRSILPDLEKADFPDKPVIPCGRPIHERLRLEISRGCSRGCRFCQAGMIYRPVRERHPDTLFHIAESSIRQTGHEDLSLLSLSAGDYDNLNTLMVKLLNASEQNKGTNQSVSFSLPSIRAGKLDAQMMETIKRVRKTGFTIAPEAGSQRLRDVINKGINENDIFSTVESAFQMGWSVIKLYFMIGLPTETREDHEQIVDLVRRLSRIIGGKGKRRQINVSVSTFVPKAHSPFQWERQISEDESWETILWLKDHLKIKNVQFKWGKTQISFLEGLLSRGDRRMTPLIIRAYQKGCRLDGWNEYFRDDLWREAITEENLEPGWFSRMRNLEETLPWDHIDSGISKDFLKDEHEKSRLGVFTDDCRNGECSGCGICDFEIIEPKIEPALFATICEKTDVSKEEQVYKKVKCRFEKKNEARFFGHLEMVNMFTKAIRRADIPVKYTQGHHKIIKIVFSNPLPLGFESLDEFFIIEVHDDFDTNRILSALNEQIPDGLNIVDVKKIYSKKEAVELSKRLYSVYIRDHEFQQSDIDDFARKDHVIFEKINKKGIANVLDLKDYVHDISINEKDKLHFEIHRKTGSNVRPEDVLKVVFHLASEMIKQADILKIKSFC